MQNKVSDVSENKQSIESMTCPYIPQWYLTNYRYKVKAKLQARVNQLSFTANHHSYLKHMQISRNYNKISSCHIQILNVYAAPRSDLYFEMCPGSPLAGAANVTAVPLRDTNRRLAG